MKKYSVRPATTTDVEQVYTLIANQNLHDYGEALLTLEDLRRSWQDLQFEANTCTAHANGVLEGYAELRDGDSPAIYLAERNNADLGFQLLTILEDIAIERKITTLYTRASSRNQILSELFLLNGYHSTITFQIMELVLHEPPTSPQCPAGIRVRCFAPGQDEQATYRTDEEASQDKGYHEPLDFDGWAKRMGVDKERFDPSLWFLACEGTEIVGVALNLHNQQTNVGWIDHLSVRRPWRKRGVGKALLLHSFGEFYRRGIRRIKLSVDSKSLTNAQHLYENLGMQTIQRYSIYKKELPL